MARPVARPDDLTPDAMMSRLAPSIDRATEQRATARADRRAQFPFMAEMTDLFRDAGMDPRPVFARNEAGETWGNEPPSTLDATPDRPMTHRSLTEYEAFWRAFYAKKKDDRRTYNERAQRAIKPGKGTEIL